MRGKEATVLSIFCSAMMKKCSFARENSQRMMPEHPGEYWFLSGNAQRPP